MKSIALQDIVIDNDLESLIGNKFVQPDTAKLDLIPDLDNLSIVALYFFSPGSPACSDFTVLLRPV